MVGKCLNAFMIRVYEAIKIKNGILKMLLLFHRQRIEIHLLKLRDEQVKPIKLSNEYEILLVIIRRRKLR